MTSTMILTQIQSENMSKEELIQKLLVSIQVSSIISTQN